MPLYHTLCVLLIFFSLCHGFLVQTTARRDPGYGFIVPVGPRRDPDLDGFLSNGLFELTTLKSEMKGRQIISDNDLPDWRISGYVELINSHDPPPGGFNFSVPYGSNPVRLGNSGLISQEVSVKRGLVYSLTFGATRSCAGDRNIEVSVSGRSDKIPIQTMFSSYGGDTYAWAFRAMSDVVNVTLQNPDLSLDRTCGPLVSFVAIKEIIPTREYVSLSPLFVKANWVPNGGFENGPYVFARFSTGVLIPAQSNREDFISPLREWFVESAKPVKYITNSSNVELQTRLPAVELIGGRESAISQVIHTLAGYAHLLSFRVGDAHNDCHGSMMVKALAGKESFNVSFVSNGKGDFKTDFFRFVAVSDRTKITFYSVFSHTKLHNSADLCGPVLNGVDLALAVF